MKDIKELIRLKQENLKNLKIEKQKEIEEIENSLEETNRIEELTNEKNIFSKMSPIESMTIIKKLGIEEEKDQREIVLNLINESLKESTENEEIESLAK